MVNGQVYPFTNHKSPIETQIKKEKIVKNKSMIKKRSGLNYVIKILLVVLVLGGLGTAGYAAVSQEENELLQADEMHVFDPFLLSSIPVTRTADPVPGAVSSYDAVTLVETTAILIPSRPVLRSPYRPPMS